jgi:hypothetical protein
MSNKKPYLFIIAYGKFLDSCDYYIKDQVAEALLDNAPNNAIYKKQDGTWATIDEVQNPIKRK